MFVSFSDLESEGICMLFLLRWILQKFTSSLSDDSYGRLLWSDSRISISYSFSYFSTAYTRALRSHADYFFQYITSRHIRMNKAWLFLETRQNWILRYRWYAKCMKRPSSMRRLKQTAKAAIRGLTFFFDVYLFSAWKSSIQIRSA